MNKKRRIISVILMLAMLLTVVSVFSGCGLFTKKIKGTEAAKILLARERLDESLVGQKLNVFSTSQQADSEDEGSAIGKFFTNLLPWANVNASVVGTPLYVGADLAPGVTVSSDTVTWNTFEDASELKASYVQFIDPIDDAAAEAAELIAKIKSDVGVTEKWVDTLLAKYMLIVDENSETIIEYYKPHESIHISTRYTTDDAKCVYEMYSFMKYDDGTSGDIRNKCIPGEYYEYTYRNSGGFNDYFIADNSRGYWMMNRFSFSESSAFFDMAAVKGDVGYGTSVSSTASEDGSLNKGSHYVNASIFSPNIDRDLMTIGGNSDGYNVSLYMTNIESGVVSLSAGPDAYYKYEDYGHVGDVYLAREDYGVTCDVDVNLTNGGKIRVGQVTDKITYNGTTVDYNMFFGQETYTGKLKFLIDAQTEAEACQLLYDYLNGQGITLRSSVRDINDAYSHSQLLTENFDVMEWYGLRMNSIGNLTEAENLLIQDFTDTRQIFEEVKDNETVTFPADVSASTKFGSLNIINKGSASYADGIIRVDALTAHTDASVLFEEGKAYTLKLGLARLDENGEYRSANTVTLDTVSGGSSPVEFTKNELELSLSGSFAVPEVLSEGEYIVVVYYATADEGIRVTEMEPVAFFSADEGKLDSEFMDVTVRKTNENLYVTYEVSLFDTVTADYSKSFYTYEEIERILIRGVLVKGYPISDAVVQNENGEALSEGRTYGAGTYRLKYLVNTSAGLVEAYMYTTL